MACYRRLPVHKLSFRQPPSWNIDSNEAYFELTARVSCGRSGGLVARSISLPSLMRLPGFVETIISSRARFGEDL